MTEEVDGRPKIDRVAGEFFRKGKCETCGKRCERIKTFEAGSFEAVNRAGADWGKQPLRHKRCEP